MIVYFRDKGEIMAKLRSAECGHIGEKVVLTELARKNYIVALLDDRAKMFDLIAMNELGTKFCAIQVKTNQNGKNSFLLNVKNEKYAIGQENCFYAFVILKSEKNPQDKIFIVPFKEVAENIAKGHQEWLSGTNKNGKPRNDAPIRTYVVDENKYKNLDFSLLNLD